MGCHPEALRLPYPTNVRAQVGQLSLRPAVQGGQASGSAASSVLAPQASERKQLRTLGPMMSEKRVHEGKVDESFEKHL